MMKTKEQPKFRVVSGTSIRPSSVLKYGRYVLAKCHPSQDVQLMRIAALWNANGKPVTDRLQLRSMLDAEFGSELLQQCEISFERV